MFDMGFTEMMLIGIVALVVIGPERLPGVARTAGKYVGRLKRFMTSVKEVEKEANVMHAVSDTASTESQQTSTEAPAADAGGSAEPESESGGATGTDEAASKTSP